MSINIYSNALAVECRLADPVNSVNGSSHNSDSLAENADVHHVVHFNTKQHHDNAFKSISFDFGINENAHNKKPVGGFEALTTNWKTKRGSVADLVGWVGSGKPIMVGCLASFDTRRSKNNVVSAQAIALDIDDGLTIEDCLKIPFVRHYAAAIYTSANHQKQKDDKAPCDRYRVIFVLPEAVTDTSLYETAVQVVMGEVGYADKACKDASRMFFGYDKTEIILCDDTKVLPANFLGEVGDRPKQEKAERARLFEKRKQRRELYQGDKDNLDELIPLALDHIDPDCDYETWRNVGFALHSEGEHNFSLWDDWSSRGQKYKDSRSLELQWSKFKSDGGIGIGSLFSIAKVYGFEFPERKFNRASGRKGDRPISPEEFGKRKASEFIQWVSEQAAGLAKRCHKGFAAATVPIVEPPKVIQWKNGDPVPSREDYGDRPIPRINYKRCSDEFENIKTFIELVLKLYEKGWESVLDSSFMGEGKTHRAALINFLKTFLRQWYLDGNHNNPSVEAIAKNYVNLFPRHQGLWRDEQGKLTRKRGAGKPVIPTNCNHADMFPALADKGYNIEGADNPICGACDKRGYCNSTEFLYKHQRSTALAAHQIRADIQSLPNPSEFDYSHDFAIIEEATTQARAAIAEVSGTWGDMLLNFDKVEEIAPELHESLKPFKTASRTLFETQQGRYGLDHDQIMEALPMSLDTNTEELLLGVAAALEPDLALTQADRVSGAGKQFKTSMKLVNDRFRSEAKDTNSQILENLPNNVLLPLLKVWNSELGSIRLEHDKLTISQVNTRKQETVKAFGFRLFLDATGNKQAIATGFGLDENSIIEIQQELPSLKNLTVYQTNMSGIKTRNRSKQAEQRVAAYKQQWQDKDPNVQFLGFKGDEDIQGWWLNHNRGSNKFKGLSNLVSLGLPYPHIGAVKAEYRTFTGSLDGFDEYYNRLVEDEVIQLVGRPRAQWFPNQQINIDIVATFADDFDLSFLTERYGITVIARDAVEFCEAAGTTKDKLKHNIFDFAKAIANSGGKLTQQAIADAVGISQQALQKHIKALWGNWLELKNLLQLFLKESIRDGCKKIEATEDCDPIIVVATLIDIFSQGSWRAVRVFLEDMPPPEARFYLGCLLSTVAIA